MEIIIVDDGSTDGSWDKILEISKLDPRIRTFRFEANRGAPQARNYGLSQASGNFILFLDADDFLHEENALETLLKNFPEDAHFVYGDKIDLHDSTQASSRISQEPDDLEDPVLGILNKCPITSTVLYRKAFFDRLRWNENDENSQEYNLIISGVIAGMKYRHIPVCVAVLRQHDSPTRITFRYWGKHRKKRAELFLDFMARLKRAGAWTPKRAAFFSYELCIMSLFLFRYAADEAEARIAAESWKAVERRSLLKSKSFRLLSWGGVSLLSNARTAAGLWKFSGSLSGAKKILRPNKP